MAADPGARPEGEVAEGLRGRRLEGGPDVDAEGGGDRRQLIDEGDVHLPEGVLDQLGHLRVARACGDDDLVDQLAVEERYQVAVDWSHAGHDLRRRPQPAPATRIDALGRVAEGEVASRLEPRSLEHRSHE